MRCNVGRELTDITLPAVPSSPPSGCAKRGDLYDWTRYWLLHGLVHLGTHIHLYVYTPACIFGVVADNVQQRLTTISEPNRFRIVELLRDGPRSVGEIVDALSLGQPQVSRHLRLLAEADVVESTKRAQQRIYRLRPESMRELSNWARGFAVLWSERMDRLGSLLDDDRLSDEANE